MNTKLTLVMLETAAERLPKVGLFARPESYRQSPESKRTIRMNFWRSSPYQVNFQEIVLTAASVDAAGHAVYLQDEIDAYSLKLNTPEYQQYIQTEIEKLEQQVAQTEHQALLVEGALKARKPEVIAEGEEEVTITLTLFVPSQISQAVKDLPNSFWGYRPPQLRHVTEFLELKAEGLSDDEALGVMNARALRREEREWREADDYRRNPTK